jgi:hypothetical protein
MWFLQSLKTLKSKKEKKEMKKVILISFMVGIAVMFGSWAMALDAPTGLTCTVDEDSVYFDWDDVVGAVKYSVDVEVPVYLDEDDIPDMIVELSFGTSDRTDGGLMGDSNLDVSFTEFVYDINGDGIPEQLSGEATGKVKALNPGKGKGSQNNPFSAACEFTLP